MQPSSWAPCPRCHSARVRYTPRLQRVQAVVVGAILTISAALGGFLIPCLWIGVPLSIVMVVAGLVARDPAGWRCLDCRETWPGPPR